MKTPFHARNRFLKRIGQKISDADLNELNKLINNENHSKLVMWEKENTIAIYQMKWKGLVFHAIYFLPEERIISFKSLDMEIYSNLEKFYQNSSKE